MAEIKMSYIFIEKQKHESKTIQEILLEIIDGVVQSRDDEIINIDDINVRYRIIQKRNSKRCFLEMTSRERVNLSIPALQKVDDALFKSSQQRYYHSIRDYDGISESFCKRLYPKYAEFERKLRSLVLFILTKAYGSNWRTETVSEELLSAIQENAHGKVSLNETLENMDLATLETYLFEKRHVDYPNIINEKFSTKRLEELEKEEICAIIEEMRPTSIWERHFEKFGSQEAWMAKILEVHKGRNKVAHQKTISIIEFRDINRKLNKINHDLTNAIEGIREDNFTEYSVVDILGSFVTLAANMVKGIMQSQAFKDVVRGFNARIQEIVKPVTEVYTSSMVETISTFGKAYENIGIAQSEIVRSMNAMAESFASTRAVVDSVATTQLAIENFASTKAVVDSVATTQLAIENFASTKAAVDSVATTQLAIENFASTKAAVDSVATTQLAVHNVSSAKTFTQNLTSLQEKMKYYDEDATGVNEDD